MDGAAWCSTPEAVFTALAPVPASVFLIADTLAAGHVVGKGHGLSAGESVAHIAQRDHAIAMNAIPLTSEMAKAERAIVPQSA